PSQGFSRRTLYRSPRCPLPRRTRRARADGERIFDTTMHVRHLLECSREVRINALPLFPFLAQRMRNAAASALKAIQDAKKFVVVSPQPPAARRPTELERLAKSLKKWERTSPSAHPSGAPWARPRAFS